MTEPTPFLASFRELPRRDPFATVPWFARLRESSITRFCQTGLPNTRHEDWRYTSLEPIAKTTFRLAEAAEAERVDAAAVAPFRLAGAAAELVFVNGHYAAHLSSTAALRPGARVDSLSAALRERAAELEPHFGKLAPNDSQPFAALNSAFVQDGALVQIARGVALEAPIHLVFVSTTDGAPVASHPRVLVLADEGSQLTVVERFVTLGSGVHLTNSVTEIDLGPGAVIEHVKLERESESAFHVGGLHVHQGRASQLASRWIAAGGALVRNEVRTVLDGEGASCTLDGLTLAHSAQHIDSQTLIDHAKPHCESQQLYKSVVDGTARSVFNGRVIVEPNAQKTVAHQTNRNLLVSATARADTKPQLEIYNDDVKCSHGATIGKLDAAAIFYLRSRGLGEDQARSLLTRAFANQVVERIRLGAIRDELDALLGSWLPLLRDSRENS